MSRSVTHITVVTVIGVAVVGRGALFPAALLAGAEVEVAIGLDAAFRQLESWGVLRGCVT
jgi:hypothetical protein